MVGERRGALQFQSSHYVQPVLMDECMTDLVYNEEQVNTTAVATTEEGRLQV